MWCVPWLKTSKGGTWPWAPWALSFHQQNKHFDRLWGSRHVEHLCHRQDQPLLKDLWVIHLLLVPTETPPPHSPSHYRLGTQRMEEHDQPATESHPLRQSPPCKPFLLPTTAEAEADFVTSGWSGLASHWTCVCVSFLSLSCSAETGVVIRW